LDLRWSITASARARNRNRSDSSRRDRRCEFKPRVYRSSGLYDLLKYPLSWALRSYQRGATTTLKGKLTSSLSVSMTAARLGDIVRGRLRDRAEGFDYSGKLAGGITSETVGNMDDEDDEGVEEQNSHDFDDDYKAEERDNDDGDGDFMPHSRTTSKNTRSLRPRSVTGRNPVRYQPYGVDGIPPSAVKRSPRSPHTSPVDMSPSSSGQPGKMRKNARTLPIPVPVPNLTKKSRGRRVPIATATNPGRGQRDAALGARIYLCDVSGCGKCFARGEHLKRHIRSIHTYEKRALLHLSVIIILTASTAHKCPYPGCGKEFSRHDNLGQHMKVHKDYPKVLERMKTGDA
jgi:hypothetical protein